VDNPVFNLSYDTLTIGKLEGLVKLIKNWTYNDTSNINNGEFKENLP